MYDFLAVDVDYNIGRGPRSHRLYVSGQSIVTWINEAAAGAFNTAAGRGFADRSCADASQRAALTNLSWRNALRRA